MSLMDEIEKIMGESMSSFNYRTINLGGKSVYIEGIRGVVNLGDSEMRFQLKKGVIKVAGNSLSVKYLDRNTCVVKGDIVSIEVV